MISDSVRSFLDKLQVVHPLYVFVLALILAFVAASDATVSRFEPAGVAAVVILGVGIAPGWRRPSFPDKIIFQRQGRICK